MMRTAYVLVVVAAACSSGAKHPPPVTSPNPPPSTADPAVAQAETTGQKVCRKFGLLSAAHCPMFEDDDLDTGPSCAEQYNAEVKAGDPDGRAKVLDECVGQLDACADVTACLDAAFEVAKKQEKHESLRACDDKSDKTIGQAVGVPRAEWLTRTLRHATKFSEIKSSQAEPVEVCGIATENSWLSALRCNDGSFAFHDASPEQSRSGNVGAGGRCRSIIDLYRVKCPEATYDIYLDGYVCPPLPQEGTPPRPPAPPPPPPPAAR